MSAIGSRHFPKANRYMKRCSMITNHQGNVSQIHNEMLPHTCRMTIIKTSNK